MTIDVSLRPAVERARAAWPVPGHHLPLAEWRERYEQQCRSARPARPEGVETLDRTVGQCDVPVRFYRPAKEGPLPALIYLHGGGWVIGSIETHDDITAALAHDAGCVVVSVGYRRAPEHPFPRAFDEVLDVLTWLHANAKDVGIDPLRLFVGGDSAGGNLSAAVAMAARDRAIALAGQVLLYPCLDTDFTRTSHVSEFDAPFMSGRQMQWFWQQYLADAASRLDPHAVPMRATDDALRGLAPAFVATAEHDSLFDEGRVFADRLRDAGTEVHFEPGPGLVHGFIRMRALSTEAGRIYDVMCAWIRDHSEARSNAPR
ncbi:MAG: alpha/beta hydrolase [Burkholderiaceae bacterium]